MILFTCNVQQKGFTKVTALTRSTSQGPDAATNPLYGPWSSGCFSCLGQGVLCFKTIAGVLSILPASAPQSEKLTQKKCRWRGAGSLEGKHTQFSAIVMQQCTAPRTGDGGGHDMALTPRYFGGRNAGPRCVYSFFTLQRLM